MRSILLQSICRFIIPFLLVLSVFLLLRGHNEPGGGFAGGLIAASSFALILLAFGKSEMKIAMRFDPKSIAGIGLVIAVLSGIPAFFIGEPYLKAIWFMLPTPLGPTKVGTPVIFDIGVYLVVIGITVSFLEDMDE